MNILFALVAGIAAAVASGNPNYGFAVFFGLAAVCHTIESAGRKK